jgi:hypothetical protein
VRGASGCRAPDHLHVAEQLEKLGWNAAEALDRAVVLYDVYVGYMQMAHVTPHLVSDAARRRQLDLVFNAFASGEPRAEHGARKRSSRARR